MNWFRKLRQLLRSGLSRRPAVPPESAEPTTPESTATIASEPAEVLSLERTETVAPTPTETANRGWTEAPPSELSASAIPERTPPAIVVVIGLDFGTSGTKVVVRRLDKGRVASAVDFGTVLTGFSRFSLPSTVRLDGSRLLFGDDAERHPKGIVFRSLKRTLMDTDGEVGHPPSPELPPPQDLAAYPHFLVAAYLGLVLRRVRELMAQEYGADAEVFYNLDIPVSQLDGGPVQRGFQTALDAAVDFAETADLCLEDYSVLWARWVDVLGRGSTGLPDLEFKRWALVPESSAIVKGAEAALASILPNSLRYTAIVDIGAGTTDVGWFRWVTREEVDRIYFFSAQTCLVGCDEVDERLLIIAKASDNDKPHLFPAVRAAKRELAANRCVDLGRECRSLAPGDLGRAVEEVAGRCFEDYVRSFGEAYKRDRNSNNWKDIRVILVGGGSQLEGFRDKFRFHPRSRQHVFNQYVDLLRLGRSKPVRLAAETLGTMGSTSVPPGDADIVFLLPALGLSHPVDEIPPPELPSDIPSSPPQRSGPTGLYVYEAPDDD